MPIDLKEFEHRIQLRPLTMDDFAAVLKLQERCFPLIRPWTKQEFKTLVRAFPAGQLGIFDEGELIASSASIILNFDEYNQRHVFRDVLRGKDGGHHEDGDTLYGLEIMVEPEYQGMKLARRLYEARKQLVFEYNLKRFVIGGRIPFYHKYAEEFTARDYVNAVIERRIFDPVLTAQIANGFVLKRLLPNYIPSDKESMGYATYLEWTNLDYQPEESPTRHNPYVRVCSLQYMMRELKSFQDFAKQCEYFVDVASDYRCDFVVFPEMFTLQLLSFMPSKQPAEAVREVAKFVPEYLELFSHLAVKYNINIIGGTIFTIEDNKLYNISYFFGRDGKIEKQYKIHITPSERRWWGVAGGQDVNVIDTDRGKIAILICYDVEFPELSRIAREKGADIFFIPSNTDERRAYIRVRMCAHARCIENQVYAVISGCVGNLPHVENLDIQYAQSCILTPSDIPFQRDGIAAEGSPNIETMVFQDLDISKLRTSRMQGSVTNWVDRRKDLYQLNYRDGGKKMKL